MTKAPPPHLEDHDLIDYADGRLDRDTARLARVEAALEASPGLTARADALRRQTMALRDAYGPIGEAPVPSRLRAVLELAPGSDWLRPAAAAVFAVAALAASWYAGLAWTQTDRQPVDRQQSAMIEAARQSVLVAETSMRVAAPVLPGRPIDLTPFGYELVDQSVVDVGGRRARLAVYSAADGRRVSILTRGAPAPASINIESRDDVSVAFWPSGPDAAVIASTAPPEETLAIARAVRTAMNAPPALAAPAPQMAATDLPVAPVMSDSPPVEPPVLVTGQPAPGAAGMW